MLFSEHDTDAAPAWPVRRDDADDDDAAVLRQLTPQARAAAVTVRAAARMVNASAVGSRHEPRRITILPVDPDAAPAVDGAAG